METSWRRFKWREAGVREKIFRDHDRFRDEMIDYIKIKTTHKGKFLLNM